MKFLKIIFLFFALFIFPACDDLAFTEEDLLSSEDKDSQKVLITEMDKKPFSEEDTTTLSEDLELSEHLIIQNKKVVLDRINIQTNEHDLTILTDEFISNDSFIHNFPEGQTSLEKIDGKSGGHVLVKAKTAKGTLSLILRGENGGFVPQREISRRELDKLSGRPGTYGNPAIYKTECGGLYIPTFIFGNITLHKDCWVKCFLHPTRGGDGENGRPGYPGYEGKRGGNSGSFSLQAFDLSDFHLAKIQKVPGLGSRGGKGSLGGPGGEGGRNGEDTKGICSSKMSLPKKGRNGRRGKRGKDGEKGREGKVCLLVLKEENRQIHQNIEESKKSLETQPETSSEKINRGGAICY